MFDLWAWLMEPSDLPRLITGPASLYAAFTVGKLAADGFIWAVRRTTSQDQGE